MKTKILTTIVCLMAVMNVALADSDWVAWVDPDGTTLHPDGKIHLYKRIDTWMVWNDAEVYAESLGGHLATVTSLPENDFIWNAFAQNGELYATLGGFQPPGTPEPDVGWQWVTGEAWEYTNWGLTQPDDAWGGQDYLTFWTGNTWDDDYINVKPYPSIVEVEIPEPATLLLLGLGGLALRRRSEQTLRKRRAE